MKKKNFFIEGIQLVVQFGFQEEEEEERKTKQEMKKTNKQTSK